jgi:hypothetical protein
VLGEGARILAVHREPSLTWWILVVFVGKAITKTLAVETKCFQMLAKRPAPNLLISQGKNYLYSAKML